MTDDPWALCPRMSLYLAESKLGGSVGAGEKGNMSQRCIIFMAQDLGQQDCERSGGRTCFGWLMNSALGLR